MCVVSMVGDHFHDRWQERFPWYPRPSIVPDVPPEPWVNYIPQPEITREEFEELRRDVRELREWLQRAKEYDARNGEPECEVAEKMERLRQMASIVGIDLDDVIGIST